MPLLAPDPVLSPPKMLLRWTLRLQLCTLQEPTPHKTSCLLSLGEAHLSPHLAVVGVVLPDAVSVRQLTKVLSSRVRETSCFSPGT